MRTALAALLALQATIAVAGPAGPAWTPVAFGGQPGATDLYFVDRAQVRRNAGGVDATVLLIHERPRPTGVARAIEHSRIDCARRGSVALAMSFHAADGRLLKTAAGDGKFERYPEGSSWRVVVDTICDSSFTAAAVPDPARYAAAYAANRR